MKLRLLPHLMLPLAPFLSVLLACGEGPANPRVPDAPPIAWSVTVFPDRLEFRTPIPGVPADMSKKVAELVGLCLERGGMKEVEIADAQFSPPEKDDLAEVAEAFGRFVQSQNLKTEYALYGQFFGTLGKGVDEIRLAVVDRQGKVVLAERLDRQQLLLKRLLSGEKRVDPMSASGYLVSRCKGFGDWPIPTEKTLPRAKCPGFGARSPGFRRRANGTL